MTVLYNPMSNPPLRPSDFFLEAISCCIEALKVGAHHAVTWPQFGPGLAGNEGMDEKMETAVV